MKFPGKFLCLLVCFCAAISQPLLCQDLAANSAESAYGGPWQAQVQAKGSGPVTLRDILKLKDLKASIDEGKTRSADHKYYKYTPEAKLDADATFLIGPEIMFGPNEFSGGLDESSPAWANGQGGGGPSASPPDLSPDPGPGKNYLSFEASLRFDGRGNVESSNGGTYKTTIYYLSLPVYALFNHPVDKTGLFGGLGPYYGFALFGYYQNSENGQNSTDKIQFGASAAEFRRSDLGLSATAGITWRRLIVQLCYDYGLFNIAYGSGVDWKNRAAGISAGYLFK